VIDKNQWKIRNDGSQEGESPLWSPIHFTIATMPKVGIFPHSYHHLLFHYTTALFKHFLLE